METPITVNFYTVKSTKRWKNLFDVWDEIANLQRFQMTFSNPDNLLACAKQIMEKIMSEGRCEDGSITLSNGNFFEDTQDSDFCLKLRALLLPERLQMKSSNVSLPVGYMDMRQELLKSLGVESDGLLENDVHDFRWDTVGGFF